ncbi:MAG: DUF4388 domain-containing protein [Candidatus Eisenbacteria bacterium]|nr:DUF4388 domain-containing protein [Candidatus Eisenbacteria bacterium]
MALQGSLEDFSLAEILQLIALQRKSGVLKLTGETTNAVIFFEKGNIVAVTDRREKRSDPLLEFFVSTERLTAEQVEQICAIRAQSKKDSLEIILTGGYMAAKQLSEAVEAHAKEVLPELLAWKKGEYHFSGDDKTVARLFFKVPMRTEALLIGSMRRLDESARIKQLYSPSLILRHKESSQKPELPEEERWVFGLMDGRRPIREILAKSRMGEFETYEVISDLIDAGLAEVAEWPAEPVEALPQEPVATGKDLVPAFGIVFVVILIALASFGVRWAITKTEPPASAAAVSQPSQNTNIENLRFALEVYKATRAAYPERLIDLVEGGFVDSKSIEGFKYATSGEGYILHGK